ncbi:MAG: DNA translocase FtsK 4TM domain-containing protein, partial [Alteraurantiacibacter sp.]|nr:DNA translocase FtsK 4TM domain-containing protein [Alteraurantiacibacter sp.]
MATRARPPQQPADWKAAFRRAMARVLQRTGSVLLFAFMVFLALALVSYSPTDPSPSTAAGDAIANWMGRSGAFLADRALWAFGLVSVLFLPLLFAYSRKLWRAAGTARDQDTDVSASEVVGERWWSSLGVLLAAMALLATALALVSDTEHWDLPGGPGGLAGLLGEGALRALVARLPEAARFWATLGGGFAVLLGGAFLAGKVFAIDWAGLLTLPQGLRRRQAGVAEHWQPRTPADRRKSAGDGGKAEAVQIAQPVRKPPEIVDPSAPPAPARPGKA